MFTRPLTAVVVSFAVLGGPLAGFAAAEDRKEKVSRQLGETDRAKVVLQFLHLGSTYQSHKLSGSGAVTGPGGKDKPGHFYLEYKYTWRANGENGNDTTTLSFFFDAKGVLTEVQVDNTTALLNQPFLLANIGIKVLGEAILDALKDDLTAAEKRRLQTLVDDADAKGLLEFALRIGLAAGK